MKLQIAIALISTSALAQLPPTNYFTVITKGEVYEYCYGGTNNGGCIQTNIQTVTWNSYESTPTSAGTFAAGWCCSSPILYIRYDQTMLDGVRLWPEQSYFVTNVTVLTNIAYVIDIPIYYPPGGLPVHIKYEFIAPTNVASDAELLYSYPPESHPSLPWPDWRSWGSPYATVTEPDDQETYGNNFNRWIWKSVSTNPLAATNVVYKVTNLGQY